MTGPKEDPITAARRVADNLFEVYVTPAGEPFVIPQGGRAIMLTPRGEGAALGVLREAAESEPHRIPRSALVETLTWLYDLAPRHAPVAELHLRCARLADGRIVVDLGEMNSTRCVVISAKGWKVQQQPPEGVHFRLTRASRPLPVPERGKGHKVLRQILGFKKSDPRWLIVRGWLTATAFANIARPLLFLVGTAGSGKTSRGVALVSVLDPRSELGGSLGKSELDALVSAGARYLAAWDNVTHVGLETSNFICRLVTGGSDERRVLYSDDDVHIKAIRRSGVITALSLPLLEPDALERIIPVHCTPIDAAERASEVGLRASFAAAHPAILAAVLDDVVTVLRRLPDVQATQRSRPRMADFSDVIYALSPAIDEAYHAATADMVREVAENDPFIGALKAWLDASAIAGTLPLSITPADALSALRRSVNIAGHFETSTWLPKTPAGLTQLLTKNAQPLAALGYTAGRKRVRGQNFLVFAAIEGGLQ